MIRDFRQEKENRLKTKTLDQSFRKQIEDGLNCSPIESKAILDIVKETFFPYLNKADEIHSGKLVFEAVDATEPAGKPLKDCKFKTVLLTYFDPAADEHIRRVYPSRAVTLRRREMIKRMANECKLQGALLTAEDLAYRILNCGMRTITRDLQYFREKHIAIPLRSQQKDIGRSLTHRVQIVEAFINRATPTEISRDYKHSLGAVENYISTFIRVACLLSEGFELRDIAFMLKISTYLVKQYAELYKKYYNMKEYKARLLEIVSEFRISKKNNRQRLSTQEGCQ